MCAVCDGHPVCSGMTTCDDGLNVVYGRHTCAILHQSLHIHKCVSHAPSCVESTVQDKRLENCAIAHNWRRSSPAHIQASLAALRRGRYARHRDQSHDHHILVTPVGVIQHAQPPSCLPLQRNTRDIPIADRLLDSSAGFQLFCTLPASTCHSCYKASLAATRIASPRH